LREKPEEFCVELTEREEGVNGRAGGGEVCVRVSGDRNLGQRAGAKGKGRGASDEGAMGRGVDSLRQGGSGGLKR
jgi:hypothetical protein